MPVNVVLGHHSDLNDSDSCTWHVENLAVPDNTYKAFERILTDPKRSNAVTQVVIANLLSHGAEYVDGQNGEAAVTVYHFDNPNELTVFSMGAELDEHYAPHKQSEDFYHNGKHTHSKLYDGSGHLKMVKFTDKKKEFTGNFDMHERDFSEMSLAITQPEHRAKIIPISTLAYAATA